MLSIEFEIEDLYLRLHDIEMEIEEIKYWLPEESEAEREHCLQDIDYLIAERSNIESQIAELEQMREESQCCCGYCDCGRDADPLWVK